MNFYMQMQRIYIQALQVWYAPVDDDDEKERAVIGISINE